MIAYKLELLIIDHDELGPENIIEQLEDARFSNDCISPKVKSIVGVDIGQWHDDHPLNKRHTCNEEYNRLFNKQTNT